MFCAQSSVSIVTLYKLQNVLTLMLILRFFFFSCLSFSERVIFIHLSDATLGKYQADSKTSQALCPPCLLLTASLSAAAFLLELCWVEGLCSPSAPGPRPPTLQHRPPSQPLPQQINRLRGRSPAPLGRLTRCTETQTLQRYWTCTGPVETTLCVR